MRKKAIRTMSAITALVLMVTPISMPTFADELTEDLLEEEGLFEIEEEEAVEEEAAEVTFDSEALDEEISIEEAENEEDEEEKEAHSESYGSLNPDLLKDGSYRSALKEDKFDLILNQMYKVLGDNPSEVKIALYIHDWVICHMTYGGYGKDVLGFTYAGYCGDYMWLFEDFRRRTGLEGGIILDRVIINEETRETTGHGWNYVNIGGYTYYIDCTNDDNACDDEGEDITLHGERWNDFPNKDYCNRTCRECFLKHDIPFEGLKYPIVTTYRYDWSNTPCSEFDDSIFEDFELNNPHPRGNIKQYIHFTTVGETEYDEYELLATERTINFWGPDEEEKRFSLSDEECATRYIYDVSFDKRTGLVTYHTRLKSNPTEETSEEHTIDLSSRFQEQGGEFAPDKEVYYVENQKVNAKDILGKAYKKYYVSNKKTVSVSDKGVLTAKNDGYSTLYGLVKKDGKWVKDGDGVGVWISNIDIYEERILLTKVGKEYNVAECFEPYYWFREEIAPPKFTSSNKKIVTVDPQTGIITSKKAGEATITIWYGEGKYAAKYKIKVKVTVPYMSKKKAIVLTGKSYQLSLKRAPKREEISWTTSNENAATVDENGKVSVLGYDAETNGKVIVTATCEGAEYKCALTVKKPGLEKKSFTLKKRGKSCTPKLKNTKYALANCTNWTTTDENVAVFEGGKIRAIGGGTAYLTTEVGGTVLKIKVKVKGKPFTPE